MAYGILVCLLMLPLLYVAQLLLLYLVRIESEARLGMVLGSRIGSCLWLGLQIPLQLVRELFMVGATRPITITVTSTVTLLSRALSRMGSISPAVSAEEAWTQDACEHFCITVTGRTGLN